MVIMGLLNDDTPSTPQILSKTEDSTYSGNDPQCDKQKYISISPSQGAHLNLSNSAMSHFSGAESGTTFYETAEEDFYLSPAHVSSGSTIGLPDNSKLEDSTQPSYRRMISVTESLFDASMEEDYSYSDTVTSNSDNMTSNDDSREAPPLIFVTSPDKRDVNGVSMSTTPSASISRDTNDSMAVDSDGEDYFEEFHLPNTHENAFVRHVSFRKKVQTTPINAPDAERIEGLVRTGEFVRHGSIRKKILPEEDEEEEDGVDDDVGEDYAFDENGSFSDGIEREIRDVGKCFSEENLDICYSRDEEISPGILKSSKLKRCYSTPINSIAENASIYISSKDSSRSIQDMSFNEFKKKVSIGEATLKKIQGCLDYSSYRDILNLSGRLSDLLSPKEVEEVLSHAEKYRQFLDSEVLEALSISYQANIQDSPAADKSDPEKLPRQDSPTKSIHNTDSGFSSPKTVNEDDKEIHTLDNDERQDDLVFRLPEPSKNLTDVRILSTPFGGIATIGIFEESSSDAPTNKRKICAPVYDLDTSGDCVAVENNDEDFEVPDEDEDNEDDDVATYKRMVSVTDGIFESSADDDDIYNIGRTERSKSISDSMRNFTTLDSSDAHDTSTLCSPQPYNDSYHNQHGGALPYDACPPHPPDLIPELTASEEFNEERHWRNVVIGGAWRRIDMKVIAPYKRCVSHGGYLEVNKNPVVLISSVYLPDKSRRDYHYVMDNLFMFVLSFVEQLAADDYIMVYLAGGRQNSGPGFHWMKKAYEMIDRRLRKNLKTLLVVHPSLWTRTIVTLSRPFISSKFYRKLRFVPNLTELAQIVSLDQLDIPDAVKQADFEIMIKEKKKLQSRR